MPRGFQVDIDGDLGDCVTEIVEASCRITRPTTTRDLARLKARCEEFLQYPLIQALDTEGL
jgi:hypothetical protein